MWSFDTLWRRGEEKVNQARHELDFAMISQRAFCSHNAWQHIVLGVLDAKASVGRFPRWVWAVGDHYSNNLHSCFIWLTLVGLRARRKLQNISAIYTKI